MTTKEYVAGDKIAMQLMRNPRWSNLRLPVIRLAFKMRVSPKSADMYSVDKRQERTLSWIVALVSHSSSEIA